MSYPSPYGNQPEQTRPYPQAPQQSYPPVVSGPPAYGQQYGQPADPGWYGQEPAPEPHKRTGLWPWIALLAAVVLLAGGVYTLYSKNIIFKDSGIKACEALASGDNKTFDGSAENKTPMTQAQYQSLRKVFADSRYDDIRSHGTKLMDIVWNVSQSLGDGSNPDSGLGVLAYLAPLTTEMTGLQSACADQGIIVNLKPGS